DRERRRHQPVSAATPEHAPDAHRDRKDGAVAIADIRDPVVDDRGELDETAERHVPDGLERRPEMDVHLRLRATGRGAVHTPLKAGAVDAHRDAAEAPER